MGDEDRLDAQEAYEVLSMVANEAGGEQYIAGRVSLPGIPHGVPPDRFNGWTGKLLRDALAAVAAHVQRDPAELIAATTKHAQDSLEHLSILEQDVMTRMEGRRRGRLLPHPMKLEQIMRYEAHLHRQLLQTLHEYEADQARGRGERAPLARLDVQGLVAS
jgi:hypothetical protein